MLLLYLEYLFFVLELQKIHCKSKFAKNLLYNYFCYVLNHTWSEFSLYFYMRGNNLFPKEFNVNTSQEIIIRILKQSSFLISDFDFWQKPPFFEEMILDEIIVKYTSHTYNLIYFQFSNFWESETFSSKKSLSLYNYIILYDFNKPTRVLKLFLTSLLFLNVDRWSSSRYNIKIIYIYYIFSIKKKLILYLEDDHLSTSGV